MFRQLPLRFPLTVLFGSLALALALVTGGCSKGSSAPNTTVGTGVLISAASTTSLTPGGSVILVAEVLGDVNNAGVTWQLSGLGTLSGQTTTQVTYVAPASLIGSTTATITAVSKADSTMSSNAAVVTSGSPLLQPQISLPANQHVGYATSVSVTGGESPYTWALVAGQLPPGLGINSSSSGSLGISGTPTAIGNFNFTLQATDANARIAKGNFSIQVNPQASCLLSGTFSFKLHGFSRTGAPATRSGTFTVDADGNLYGVTDVKADIGTSIGVPITSGTCQNQTGNHGVLNLNTPSGTLVFNWAILTTLNEGYMQELDGYGIAGTAHFLRQDPAITSAASLGGPGGSDYAFGVLGTDANSVRLGLVGQLKVDATGAVTGTVDANGSEGLSAASLSGSFSAPSAAGRGTLQLNVGGKPMSFVYYAVSDGTTRRLFLTESDTSAGTPLLAGDATVQAAGLGSGSLAPPSAPGVTGLSGTPAILELWSASGTHYPESTTTLGQLYQAVPSTGFVQLTLDTASGGSNILDVPYYDTVYAVGSGGRFTLHFGSGAALRDFVGYLDGTSSGYLIETTAGYGNGFGYLEPQSGFPYYQFQGNIYLGTTILPPTISPITLLPSVSVAGGTIGGDMNGQYALDLATGRALAELSRSVFGGSGLIMYLVGTNKIVMMGNGANAINTQIGWLIY